MKFHSLLLGLLSALTFSCTVSEIDPANGPEGYSSPEPEVFYVSIDDQPGAETKVYADEQLRVLWNHDDRISIFNKTAYNREYSFQGNDGDNSGAIKAVGSAPSGTVPSLDPELVYAVYPYQESTSISTSGAISFDIPATQYYKENSFGLGANIMLSATDGNKLRFKNVGGYLALKMYGSNVKVSSIILRGNSEEVLAGPSTIQMAGDTTKVLIDGSASTASKQIRLYCETPVELGSSSSTDDCKVFWIVVPPVEFTNGFNVTIATPDGKTFTQSTSKSFTIRRSAVTRLSPFEVKPSGSFKASVSKVTSTRPISDNKKIGGSKNKEYVATFDRDTISIMLPTVTDLSNNVALSYVHTGDKILINGQEVRNGDVLKATGQKATLMVCKGDAEKRYTLKVTNTGLPVVRIETSDYFTLAQLESYKNSLQNNDGEDLRVWLPEAKKEFVTISIEKADGTPGMKNGTLSVADTKIKGRGNYTWTWDKKPYALKFDKKMEVLGMPAHKRWILLANWRDRTLLRNDAAFWLSREAADMPYTVRGQFVELEINGVHRGNYYLCEQIKIDTGRVNITEIDYGDLGLQNTEEHTGGYLMEIDSYFDEVNKFHSSEFGLNYMFKEPDEEKLTKTDSLYMSKYINDLEKIIKSESGVRTHKYDSLLDVDSAIKFMLLNELTGNRDFFQGTPHYGPHSTYLYKDAGKKLFMGPIWDFDYETFIPKKYYPKDSYWDPDDYKWRGFDNPGYYYYWLCYDSDFVQRIKDLWAELKTNSKDAFGTYIDEMVEKIGLSQEFDEEMWPFHNEKNRNDNHDFSLSSYEKAIETMKSSFSSKVTWMDNKIKNLGTTSPTFKYD